MKIINVVAAVIAFDGKLLCVRRGPNKYSYIAYKYEFPGGKIEYNESPKGALIREIHEELQIDIRVDRELLTVDHQYPDFRIILHSYLCFTEDDNLKLTEHIEHQWLSIPEMVRLDWADADMPIVENLLHLNGCDFQRSSTNITG